MPATFRASSTRRSNMPSMVDPPVFGTWTNRTLLESETRTQRSYVFEEEAADQRGPTRGPDGLPRPTRPFLGTPLPMLTCAAASLAYLHAGSLSKLVRSLNDV